MVKKYHFLLVSPDGQWILGQAPELQNYFVAAAMRSIGAGAAGGIGEAIANHIIEGRPPFDMYNLVSTYLINTNRMNHQCCPGENRPETPWRPSAGGLRMISAGTTLLGHTVHNHIY